MVSCLLGNVSKLIIRIYKVESDNEVYVSGILNELDIVEGETPDGRGWIRGTADIRVDQEIGGKMTESIVPVKMFSMRKKKDGSPNQVYDRIAKYKEDLISLAAAEDESQASKITVSLGKLEENSWYDTSREQIRNGFQISSNFLNKARESDTEGAKFKVSGVVGKMRPEIDKNGDETGRLIVSFIIVGYAGRANVVEMIAEGSGKNHIEANWNEGDTVSVTGRVNMTFKTVKRLEEQGFGEPIERTFTESRRELIITGGSQSGLEEAMSYDDDSVKRILNERIARQEEMKNKSKSKAKSKPKASDMEFAF